jgi:hypothetical protein
VEDKIMLFYILYFNKQEINIPNINNNLVISLYNETKIDRYLELLFCLKTNIENGYISKIHILFENIGVDNHLFNIIHEILNINMTWKKNICFSFINKRPTYADLFNYSNDNICGNTIIANSDIVYNESLSCLKYLKEDDFICLTRYQKYDKFKLIELPELNNKLNIFSQDSWMFVSPMKYNIECNMELGKMFCDSFLNYKLTNTEYKCYNLCEHIKSYHIHNGVSESQLINGSQKKIDECWNIVYKLDNYKTKNFVYGLFTNTLDDFINKTNHNNFIDWNNYANT